jgi:prepilin signal peptidase PulO-like enzyme (type II secretory pathway)
MDMEFDVWSAALFAAPAIREPRVPLWVMELTAIVLLYIWLFCFGACAGSFLNVVVYRLPRGLSLAHPGSCCPRCGHAIRLWDNIPILSWLVLRGRCRDCGTRISARYFWIELLAACMFLAVALWERSSIVGVWGYETRPPLSPYEIWPYWSRYATHVALLTTLLGGVLILGDHFSTTPKLFVPAIVLGFVLPLIWPEVRSVPAWNFGKLPGWQAGLIDGLAAITLGVLPALLGSLWRLYSNREWPTFSPLSWTAAFAVVLGWQRAMLWLAPVLLLYLLAAGTIRALWPETEEPEPAAGDSQTELPPTELSSTTEPPPPTPEEPLRP